jgi:ATP-binding cassette subfamily B protein
MPFFEHTTAGVLTRHMQQTEKLRHFLTGRLFQTLLDCTALPLLICLLMSYSPLLSCVVLGFALLIAAIISILIPSFKHCLNQLYQAEGARQAHLVETIHGVRTIKSLAMEPVRQSEWDTRLAASLRRLIVVGRISTTANVVTSTIDKLTQIAVLRLGANMVFSGVMSIGALVAFTMLASRVSGPLLQIVTLINEYQETVLSARMLATIMDHPPERAPDARAILPTIGGGIAFDNVSFRYPDAPSSALDRVSFEVREGEIIGVVGRSGSGKTTLIRLIQGIQTAQTGLIKLSGTDIRHIDLGHLRRNVAVVLQDSFLFRGSIRANIAAGNPLARLDSIVEAAHLAGADEFIDRLPLGYETIIEEGAVNLSGGQRQRLSIARALLIRPRLLIFDEATSALDPESEAILQANLKQIARGRTMIVVSHRLSSLVQSDRILVLERSRIVDFAPHADLVDRCEPYRSLWFQQTQHVHA